VVDHAQKFNALTLACYLDKLEVVHFLDLHSADLSQGAGKFNNTPLMAALAKWNVRIIDYLLERGVDSSVTDSFGFTATKKAELMNLRTITMMLKSYDEVKKKKPLTSITNEEIVRQLKLLNVKLQKLDKKHKPLEATQFSKVEVWKKDNDISTFRPSSLLSVSEYPMTDLHRTAYVATLFGGLIFFNSNDPKFIN
jgi:hypothetical protein